MKIRIAIVVLCWLVLFGSAHEIENESIQKVIDRNTLSIGTLSDSVTDFVSDFVSDFNQENTGSKGGTEDQNVECLISFNPEITDTDGDGVGDICDICQSENASGFDANEDGCIDK